MKRREFLKRSGSYVAVAGLGAAGGCSNESAGPPKGTYAFPQGVASGDPAPTSVMLWTRAVWADHDGTGDPVPVTLEVSKSADFDDLTLFMKLSASQDSDFTLRVLVEKLAPATTYFYRFTAGSDVSRTGRTRTAPNANADVPVRFAWASCQQYTANYYGAWRQLLNDDAALAAKEQLDFVLFIGDFIYETYDSGTKLSLNDDLEPQALVNGDGKPRNLPKFPSGGGKLGNTNFANTVDDYRHLYKHYLLDPDLQDARARWPFVSMWDDHEFTDDCWQTQANYDRQSSTDEPSQKRRVAASQAWFEYVPTVLSEAEDELVPPQAKDFEFVKVEDAKYTEMVDVTEPNNLKAISAITTYRNFRFGKHVDLVLTDNRSYRSDQPIPEDVTKDSLLIFAPRNALPLEAVNVMDAGKTADGGKPPDEVAGLMNTRKGDNPGTMLGAAQKAWWKKVMSASDATFRIWGNSVPLLRLRLDAKAVNDLIPADLVLTDDAWDGYNTERKELMRHLQDNEILNVISLSGDHHANYAGVVYDDFDADQPTPVMIDLCAAAISSPSQFSYVAQQLQGAFSGGLAAVAAPVFDLITYDATKLGGTEKTVVNINTLILYGSEAAKTAAQTNDLDKVEAARNASVNPHLRYADANAWGYGLCTVDGKGAQLEIVTVERSFNPLGNKSPGIRCKAGFSVPPAKKASEVALPEPEISGKKPFPLR